jgi:hypothetical protein
MIWLARPKYREQRSSRTLLERLSPKRSMSDDNVYVECAMPYVAAARLAWLLWYLVKGKIAANRAAFSHCSGVAAVADSPA